MIWLLAFLACFAAPAVAQAQLSALRVEGTGKPVSASVARHRGYPAFPAGLLEALGAQVEPGPRGARVLLFGDTLHFEAASPFFTAGRVHQLAAPVYREGGTLYIPGQFFVEWLPGRYPDRLEYRAGVLRLVAPENRPGLASETPSAATRAAAASRRRADEQVRVVVIDPGHGGVDPGKVGPNGLREKDVTLAIAKRLAALLQARPGYEVHLTRTKDTLIALADRPHLANKWKAGRPAAVFLSIHANSGVASASGFETYFLSEARTEDERRVAEMENAAVAYETAAAPQAGEELDRILNSLRNDFYLRASNDLAAVIQRRLADFHPGPSRGVKQAGFRVLVGAFMPAALVEVAFISHPREARLLASSSFQQKVAWALAEAVDQFFDSHAHLLATEGGA